MAIQVNLAMTGGEISRNPRLPPNIAWMACHFSPWGGGLSNLPQALPEGSLLVLDDETPLWDHDPEQILRDLSRCVRDLGCAGVLLDFQRPKTKDAAALAKRLCQALPCPTAATAAYARETGGPVFLPPLPCHVPLAAQLAPWQEREVWLELALDREVITLTAEGAEFVPGDFEAADGFAEENLHCHYTVAVEVEKAVFQLWRTREDLAELIREADRLGVPRAVGLYQELGVFVNPPETPYR